MPKMFQRLPISDVFLFTPKRHGDARGFFVETFSKSLFEPLTGALDWVQDNHSRSDRRGVLRGLHLQAPPHAQNKLVRCVRGSVLDVAVDVRRSSATFGQHVSVILSEGNGVQIFVPEGFAHGFVTLEPNAEVIYKMTSAYQPESERGVLWSDPTLAIDWCVPCSDLVLSERDRRWGPLGDGAGLGF